MTYRTKSLPARVLRSRVGLVFDIKRFALHDGPGIRSTAFLKGCPLNCTWCQNPEGISPEPILWYTATNCIHCGACFEGCPSSALSQGGQDGPFVHIDRAACTSSGACVELCPSGALHFDSRDYSVEDLVRELERDAPFFRNSGGGITLSGGEPLFQPDFATEILRECRQKGLHTAIETTLFCSQSVLERFLPLVDLFLADLKLMDPEAHRTHTGVDNAPILENFRRLAQTERSVVVRVPLIPGVTTVEDNLRAIGSFIASLGVEWPVELLNFNPLAEGKYRSLERPYEFAKNLSSLPQAEVDSLKALVSAEGVHVI
jgi:pyruvate formate lyase activating enzyme